MPQLASALQPARPEYRQLAADLTWHAECFDVRLPPGRVDEVTALLTALECADRLVDELPTLADREAFAADVLHRLETGNGDVDPELVVSLDALRAVLLERRTLPAFLALTGRAFEVAERIRIADCRHSYIDAVHEEGRLTPAMTLCVLGDVDPEFEAFFHRLGDVGNFVDELVDVRWDFRNGDRALRPGPVVHAHLTWRLVSGTLRAARQHPRPLALVTWGLGYLWRPAMSWLRG